MVELIVSDMMSKASDHRAHVLLLQEKDGLRKIIVALGLLEAQASNQFGALRNVSINSLARWGNDPARPDLKLCTLTVLVTAHRESFNTN